MTARRQVVRAVGALAAVLITGCGTTVQLSDVPQQSVAGTDDLGLTAPSPVTAPTSGAASPTLPPSAIAPSATGSGITEPTASGSAKGHSHSPHPGGSPSATLPSGPTSGRGFTAKTITVGVVIPTDGGGFVKSLGVSDASGDLLAQYQVIARYINAHGGVAGRRLILKSRDVDIATFVGNPSFAAQEVCAAFTQDTHVFAVLQPVPSSEQRNCLERAQTPIIDAGTLLVPGSDYTKHPDLLFGPGKMTTDLAVKLLIQSLSARHFFQGWNVSAGAPGKAPVKVGLLYADTPDARYAANLEVRALRAIGLKISATVTYAANLTAGLAATQAAVLRFKAQGITHVLGASAFFLEDAQTQGYRPRYVIPIGSAQGYTGVVPVQQMVGAMSVGFKPADDVDGAHDPGPVSAAQTKCTSIMRKGGQSPSARAALSSMEAVCDVTFLLRDALAGATGLSNAVLAQGVDRLGTSWHSAQTFKSDFSAAHHASAVAIRDIGYAASCSCMKYTGTGLRE